MFDEPEERPDERPQDPATRAKEKSDEFRMHAEFAAVLEGRRKFDAALKVGLDPELAREVQRTVARLDKARSPDSPILPDNVVADAAALLRFPATRGVSTNDYYVHRRPGEVVMVRWLEGEQVDTFYERLQAHFDVGFNDYRDEEKQMHEWKQDAATTAYLKALDAMDIKLADRYLREPIRTHNLFVLSTWTADEMDILHLCDYLMGVSPEELVGKASAPPEEPTERDRAWFFRLYSLRGMDETTERMCFFAYLQKAEDTFESDW
jgi:hypothetical protein